MLVRELIQDILDEIGQLVGGNPASDSDAAKCRRLINKCVRDYNVQGFLHFTKSRVPLGQGKVFMFEDKVPLTVNNVYYKVGPEWYSLDPVRPETLPAYEGCGTIPYKFCYEKYFEGNDLKGRVTLDRTSGYDIEAVVTYDMEPFNDNDVARIRQGHRDEGPGRSEALPEHGRQVLQRGREALRWPRAPYRLTASAAARRNWRTRNF